MASGKKLYDRLTSRHMLWGVGVASVLESTVVPIPLEIILIPIMQTNRKRIWRLALAALLGCIIGASIGYGIGFFLYESIGSQLVNLLGNQQEFENIQQAMHQQGFWFVLSVGVTPVPFQLAMIAAGLTSYSIPFFLLATAIARGVRYFGLALLVYHFGNRAERIYREHKTMAIIIITVVVIGIWIVFGYLL